MAVDFHVPELEPSKPLEWLIKNFIPMAAVTLLAGDEGIGNSALWVWPIVFNRIHVVAVERDGSGAPTFLDHMDVLTSAGITLVLWPGQGASCWTAGPFGG